MSNFKTNIDKLVAKILEEEIQSKTNTISEKIEEGLSGGQKFIAKQAKPKNKIDAKDFEVLRNKKKETKEQTYFEDEFIDDEEFGDYEGDKDKEIEAEKLSMQEPTYVGRGLSDNKPSKIFGSFTETGDWYDETDRDYKGQFDFDYDEEEFDEFEPFYEKHGKNTNWFAPGEEGKKFFNMYKDRFGPMIVRVAKGLEEEAETEEGNEFTGALAKAKEKGEDSFEVDGKRYPVKESKEKKCSKCGMKNCKCNHKQETKEGAIADMKEKISAWAYDVDLDIIRGCKKETKGKGLKAFQDCLEKHGAKLSVIGTKHGDSAMGGNWKEFGGAISKSDYKPKVSKKETKESEEKWIQKTDMKKGSLHKKLGIPDGEKIPVTKLKSIKKELMNKSKGDKKLSAADSKLLKQVNLALTLKDIKENVNTLRLSENELIDLIEKIVIEEQKSNIKSSEALGYKKTMKALDASKKENDDYAKEVTEKMKNYLKDMGGKNYEMNPEEFPENNYTAGDMKEKTMKYHPSKAVDEYIEAFAYPGMTNLVFDEIKPDDEKIEMYLKGNSKTGNATKDKDGKALGNVVPSEAGERFMKNYKDNLYGAEQMNVSYKRQPQPVDVNGSEKMDGSLKSIRKGSTAKAGKIMSQLESTEEKDKMKINEDVSKMKKLISYNSKTQ